MKMIDAPVPRQRLYKAIIDAYLNNAQLTARECAVKLYEKGEVKYPLRDSVAPRINELIKLGKMETVGSKYDPTTRKTVTIYQLVQ